jgi:hypothetical protein
MIRLNQTDLNQYLKKTEAEEIYMKKINSINMSFTSILTSIQSLVATYDYQFSTLNQRVAGIENDTSNLNIDISNLKLWKRSAYSSITSLENQTLYLNNEFYSIKTNTDQIASNTLLMSNMLSTLTGGGLGYNYWEQFGKDSNETYIDYAINSTVVKNEQLTYNGNLSQSVSNIDKKEYVLNSNILNTVFTIETPLNRLGLKLNSTNSPLRATAENIDIAAYTSITLNSLFNLKCNNLNCIHSGGYVREIRSNVWANTINFNSPPISYYDLDLNPNVQALNNLPTQATLYFTNNGNNVISLSGKYTFACGGSILRTFKNLNLSSHITFTRNEGDLLMSNITLNNDVYNSFNCNAVTMSNVSVKGVFWGNHNTVNSIKIQNCTFDGNNNLNNYFGHATMALSNNNIGSVSIQNPGFLDMVGNTCNYCRVSGNLHGGQLTFSDNTFMTCYLAFTTPGSDPYSFKNNSMYSLTLSATDGSFDGFTNLKNLSVVSLDGANYKVYNMIKNAGNFKASVYIKDGELLSNTYKSCRLFNNLKLNICSFSYLTVSCPAYSSPQIWRYVTADNIDYGANNSVFFCNMLNIDNGFFHVKVPNFWQGVEGAFQNANNNLDFASEVLVDNPVTTSVNLMVTPNANRRIHANFMSLQPSIKSVNLKGWLPSQIVDFDQFYMFNNIASGLINEPVNFTLNVDNVNDWVNYKQFFNPFGDNNPDRIIIDQN